MKTKNLNIVGTGIYHPSKKVDNNYFLNQLQKEGLEEEKLKEAKNFMQTLGREERYIIDDEEENTLTMGLKASKEALQESKISEKELDMIVFATDTPEYTYPSNALLLNDKLDAENAHIVYDLNSNCIGMLTAFDQVTRYMESHDNINHALVVGSVHASSISKKDDPLTYPIFSDGSAAVVLRKRNETRKRGFIDSINYTNTIQDDVFRYPNEGFSNILNSPSKKEEEKLRFSPEPVNFFSDDWTRLIEQLLEKNNLSKKDIDHVIFSQFSRPQVKETLKKLGMSLEKTTYVGHLYGYTGVTSPFFALHNAVKEGKIEEGSNVVLTSVGAGYTMSVILYKF